MNIRDTPFRSQKIKISLKCNKKIKKAEKSSLSRLLKEFFNLIKELKTICFKDILMFF